jgi:CarboxypepD_reg-like domain
MKAIITFFITLFIASVVKSQTDSSGELQGRVYDEVTNEGIPFAPLVLESNGMQKGIGQTDESGYFTIKPIIPGNYEMRVQYFGYRSVHLQEIHIVTDRISFQNVSMQSAIEQVNLSVLDIGNIRVDYAVRDTTCTPVRSTAINQIAMTASADHTVTACLSVYGDSQNDPNPVVISNCRVNATVYIIDGFKVRGPLPLVSHMQEISIITGGIPAKYENATDGNEFPPIEEFRNSITDHSLVFPLRGVR